MYKKPSILNLLRSIVRNDWRDSFVLSTSEFDAMFQREMALTERSLRSFALVAFPPHATNGSGLGELSEILQNRVRVSDSIGILDDGLLAVLMPETDGGGAGTFASDVMAKLGEVGLKFNFKIFVYPGSQDGVDSGGQNHSDQSGDQIAQDDAAVMTRRERTKSKLGDARVLVGEQGARDLRPLCCEPLSLRRRSLDIVVASLLMIAGSPVFALVALAVKLTSRGPVFYTQKRAGQGGAPFDFYKFRSMYVDADARKAALADKNEQSGPIFKMKNDPRMTPIGKFLRRASLDELPQLYNVLKGDMTLVGPRPPTLDEVADYEPWQLRRLCLKGGLTCTWQVSGRSEIAFEEWVRMDLRYAQQRGLALDLGLLAKTANAVVSGRGAY